MCFVVVPSRYCMISFNSSVTRHVGYLTKGSKMSRKTGKNAKKIAIKLHNLTLVRLILSWISRVHRINPSCFQRILILLIQSFNPIKSNPIPWKITANGEIWTHSQQCHQQCHHPNTHHYPLDYWTIEYKGCCATICITFWGFAVSQLVPQYLGMYSISHQLTFV